MRHLLVMDSDIIHSVGFKPTAYLLGTLEIVFKADTNTVYSYERVAFDQFVEMLGADSIGKSFHEKFRKTKHPFTKSMTTTLQKSTTKK